GSALDLDTITDKKIEEIMEVFQNNKVEFATIQCVPNHLEGDPVKRRENNDYFKKALKMCKKFGTDVVMTGAWANSQISPEENLKVYKVVFNEFAKVAEDEGVRIAVENCPAWHGYPMVVGNISYSPEMWDAMFELVPSKAIGLEYDPSHLYWLGIDYIKVIRDYGDRIYMCHAKDTEIIKDKLDKYGIIGRQLVVPSEGWWRYRIPGWGQIDWKEIFKALNDVKFDKSLVIEHEDPVFGGLRTDEGLKLGLRHLRQFKL
ncbi:MAG: sugar phosphate isomerase/epimerase, partial [Clostridiales bacterium]|nr:sugar phosphate isomerase/epimerase [Clostridiales bacterium]